MTKLKNHSESSECKRNQTERTSPDKSPSARNKHRVLDSFENMDLGRFSNDNTLLWYNLNLIEESIDEMSHVCQKMVHTLGKIHTKSDKLMLHLEMAKEDHTRRTIESIKSAPQNEAVT